jgi:hypothetical protein
VTRFHGIKGTTAERVELFTSGDYHAITVRFLDKTSLSFAIEAGFSIKADYEHWKTGNRLLKSWPEIRSER